METTIVYYGHIGLYGENGNYNTGFCWGYSWDKIGESGFIGVKEQEHGGSIRVL